MLSVEQLHLFMHLVVLNTLKWIVVSAHIKVLKNVNMCRKNSFEPNVRKEGT